MTEFLKGMGLTLEGFAAAALKIILLLALMLVCSWLIGAAVRKGEERLRSKNPDAPTGYLRVLRAALRTVIYLLFFVQIFSLIPGLEALMKSVLAGSGVIALIVGVAAQDAVNNIISGVMIQLFKPFKKGDVIRYVSNDLTGVVEEIGIRQTVIRTPENKRVIIPNGTINSSVIENSSYGESDMSFLVEVGVTYESDLKRAMALMAEAIAGVPGFVDRRGPAELQRGDGPVTVRVQRLDDSAVVLGAWCWATDRASHFQLKSDMLLAVKERFDQGGVGIAYPHMVVIGENVNG